MRKIKDIAQLRKKYKSYRISKDRLRHLIEKGTIGRVKGIIGPYVLRYQDNELIISDRAVVYNASYSPESVQNRTNFGASVKFARSLNSVELLKKIWSKSEVPGSSVHHKILKQNKISSGYPAESNIITPVKYILHNEIQCSIDRNFTICLHKNKKLNSDEKLLVIICPYEPLNSSDSSFEVLSAEITMGQELRLTEDQIGVCCRYKKYIIYSALVKESEGILSWSNTAVYTGEMPISIAVMEKMVNSFHVLYLLQLSTIKHPRKIMLWDG